MSTSKAVPILKPLRLEYKALLTPPGSCAVYLSNDKKTVFKQAICFDLRGCSPSTTAEYHSFSEESAVLLERERVIYERLGTHPRLLRCIETRADGLVFEYLRNGDLRKYLHSHKMPGEAQQRLWAKHAVEAIAFAHSKDVLIADVNARNFLVQDDLGIVLSDFSGSGIDAMESLVCPETRYQKIQDDTPLATSISTEIFAIGSLLYEICAGVRPYDTLPEDDEVEALFRQGVFPDLDRIALREVISACWHGEYRSAREVLQALMQQHMSTDTIFRAALLQ